MTREIYTGKVGGGQQDTSLINYWASVDNSMPSCHSALIDGQSCHWTVRERELEKADGVCVHGSVLAERRSLLLKNLKPHEMHSFCLFSIAAVINPSLLPWGMAGRTIITLRSKPADFSLCFIIRHSGQVFWKVWIIVVVIGKDGVTLQPLTYASAKLTSSNEVINSPAKQNLLAIRWIMIL